MTKYGIIVARFHVDVLHRGHQDLITEVIKRHGIENTLILLGDRKTLPTTTIPLSYETRRIVVQEQFPNANIRRLWDMRDDLKWSQQLDRMIANWTDNEGATLYTGRDGFDKHYPTKTYYIEHLDFGSTATGSERRQWIAENPELQNRSFRRGMIYQQFQIGDRTYTTVDIAVTRVDPKYPNDITILVGQKKNEDQWRLPGGFREKGELLKDAARRELKEETGLDCEHPLTYVDEFVIKDWRIRDAQHEGHTTTLFHTVYGFGPIKAADDLERVQWLSLRYLVHGVNHMVVEEHRQLILAAAEFAVKHYGLDK